MDNAVDLAAARTKGLRRRSRAAPRCWWCPSIDAGNMLAKQLTYVAHAEAAGW